MIFIVQAYGDLPTKAPLAFALPRCFYTLEESLAWLSNTLEFDLDAALKPGYVWFDPEDDRIVIWQADPDNTEDNTVKAVWHASGWHWQYDAADLAGGPLEQGKLPGYNESVYDIASKE